MHLEKAFVSLGLATLLFSPFLFAGHAFAEFGKPKYPADFTHFEYADPNAPHGGVLNLSSVMPNNSFDKYNPFTLKGKIAPGLSEMVFETLTTQSLDEENTIYGLLAEDIQVADDLSSVTFRINSKARFSNGDPVTAKEVKYSFKILTSNKSSPRFKSYFSEISNVVVLDQQTVRFEFSRSGRDLVFVAGSLPVFSPKWAKGPDGKPIAFDKVTLQPPIATGPYTVSKSSSGRNVIFTKNPDYWARDLPVRRGFFNFDQVVYKLYKNKDTMVAAMRAGDFDFFSEVQMRYWCCQFIGKRFDDKEIIKQLFPHKNPHPMNGYIFNLRRPQFQDVRVRKALNYAYDWEWLNGMIFDNQFERQDSYFANSPLAARGLPSAAELKLLEPYRSQLNPDVFGPVIKQPSTKAPGSYRANLRIAAQLLAQAGWKNRGDGVLRNDKGEPFILRVSGNPSLLEAFYRNIRMLGIVVEPHNSDPSIDRENLRQFNFDFTSIALRESRSPGPELYRNFHSEFADETGSENLLGLKSPVVDALIDAILNANTREEQATAASALDRVMLSEYYVLPWRYLKNNYVMFQKRLKHPATLPDYYGATEWAIDNWWDGSTHHS